MTNQTIFTFSENAYYAASLLLYLAQENKITISDEIIQSVINLINDKETDLNDSNMSKVTVQQVTNLLMLLGLEEETNE